jgi:hypothetical protein
MKMLLIASVFALTGAGASHAPASARDVRSLHDAGLLQLAGNTSSNSSSNTSSNQSNGRSTIRHTHEWSVYTDDDRRRFRGSRSMERHDARPPRYRSRRERGGDDDD